MDKNRVKIDYDPEHDILYMEFFPEGKVVDTTPLADDVYADVGEDNRILGIEVWNASKNMIEPIALNLSKTIEKRRLAAAKL